MLVIMLNNRDLSMDLNRHDYDFCHNRAALQSSGKKQYNVLNNITVIN